MEICVRLRGELSSTPFRKVVKPVFFCVTFQIDTQSRLLRFFFDVTTEGITTLIIVTRLSGKNTEKRKRLFRQQQELKWRHSHLLQ